MIAGPLARLTTWARMAMLACVLVSGSACARPAGEKARVPHGSVAGRAAAAVGDSGIFASPVEPRGIRHFLPHADAESAAVAMGYWAAPSFQDLTVPYPHDIPTERRRFCGRTYYVRPVVEMPDTLMVRSNTGNDWMMWAGTWVMPICDDEGIVRSSVHLTDLPAGLRVRQGPGPRDVPELVPDSGTFPHIGQFRSEHLREWERGIGLTPESAVAVVMALLRNTGAHVAEIPEAFTALRLLDPSPPTFPSPRIVGDAATCPRWRLTLDRPVTVRGAASGQIVRTETLYVARPTGGCEGAALVQIPVRSQPSTVPFVYDANLPVPGRLIDSSRASEFRSANLRVLEPLWFEEARLE